MYKRVELSEGQPVHFVGVYVTRWQREWGNPTVGFVEAEYQPGDAINELATLDLSEYQYKEVLAILRKLM